MPSVGIASAANVEYQRSQRESVYAFPHSINFFIVNRRGVLGVLGVRGFGGLNKEPPKPLGDLGNLVNLVNLKKVTKIALIAQNPWALSIELIKGKLYCGSPDSAS